MPQLDAVAETGAQRREDERTRPLLVQHEGYYCRACAAQVPVTPRGRCDACNGQLWVFRPYARGADRYQRLYADDASRRAGVRAKHLRNVRLRASRDLRELAAYLPEPFALSDVGHKLRGRGRHWSEGPGVVGRWWRLGVIRRTDDAVSGARRVRQWVFVPPEERPDLEGTT